MATSLGKCMLIHCTSKAILLAREGGEDDLWVPLSVIDEESDVPESEFDDPVEVFVADWWAEKNGVA